MSWLTLALISYFLTALVVVVDKFLLSRKVRNSLIYAFYVGILNGAALLLWPFDFSFLPIKTTLIALFAGASFFLAIFFFYSAVRKGEISRIVAFIGGVSPLFVLFLSYFFLEERLPVFWLVGFVVLIMGSFLIAIDRHKTIPLYSFAAAVFFALSFFATKVVFLESTFLNGFIWTRVSTLFLACALLFFPYFKLMLARNPFTVSRRLLLFFVSNKALGAFSFLLLNYAIMLGSVSVVNALQGVEYVFILILALVFSYHRPEFIRESFSLGATVQKITGIALISLGVIFLFVA
jgi:uncharacterized membrane protein